jgi:4-amino-4-deoxychorismate lyase
MYPLLETIKIKDGIPRYLPWHQRRMDYAFHVLIGSANPFQLEGLIKVPEEYSQGVYKCRILYSGTDYSIEYTEYTPRTISSLKLVHCDILDYSHKYSNRSMLTNLVDEKGDADDILIVREGLITDTSFSNILFFDGKEWLTPAEPLLEGTCRNRLLAEGEISTANIHLEDLPDYSVFRLINAMLDFDGQPDIKIESIINNSN